MLFERSCPGCGVAAKSICPRCLTAVEASRPLEQTLQGTASALGLTGLQVIGSYGPPLKQLALKAKNGGRCEVYRRLAPLFVVGPGERPHVVTWIPPNRTRRRKRGFDHGHLLAAQIARRLGVEHRRLLVRVSLGESERRTRPERLAGPQLIANRPVPLRVLLVDDILTTGGSLAAGAAALRRAGAQEVFGAALAMVDTGTPAVRHSSNRR